jgi:hypothetical protein
MPGRQARGRGWISPDQRQPNSERPRIGVECMIASGSEGSLPLLTSLDEGAKRRR